MYWKPSFGTLLPWKFGLIIPWQDFILVLKYLSLYKGSPSNLFLITLLTLSQILLSFRSNLSFLSKRHIFSFIKICYVHIHFGSIIHKGLTFLPSLYPIKCLKHFLPMGTLLDTTILSTFTSYIEIVEIPMKLKSFI